MSLVESPFPEAFYVKWYGKEKIYATGIPKLTKRVLRECAQRPGKSGLPPIFQSMDRLHKGSVVYSKGPRFPEIPLFCNALQTSVVFSCSGNEGQTAS
ncbi:MAG: hypothetical protein JRJ47_14470 [Deltaproteobacteria bacterium]|nr:hypothetical protein [Deltaproteobacteria bacterium]